MSEGGETREGRDWSLLCVLGGLFSITWAVVILVPGGPDLPAWPAASAGVVAIALGRAPGRALLRGIGAFFGLIGLLVGLGKILALWGLLELMR